MYFYEHLQPVQESAVCSTAIKIYIEREKEWMKLVFHWYCSICIEIFSMHNIFTNFVAKSENVAVLHLFWAQRNLSIQMQHTKCTHSLWKSVFIFGILRSKSLQLNLNWRSIFILLASYVILNERMRDFCLRNAHKMSIYMRIHKRVLFLWSSSSVSRFADDLCEKKMFLL